MASRRGRVNLAARKALVDVLAAAGFAHDKARRALLVGELETVLECQFTFSDQLAPRDELLEVVNACGRLEDGMEALADVFELMRPGTPECAELRRLVSSLWLRDVIPETEQELIRARLTGLAPPGLAAAVRRAARDAAVPPPRYEDAWMAFSDLADFNAAPEELPPALVFIELIGAECGGPLGADLIEWTTRQARRLRLDGALRRLRSESRTAGPAGRLHLVIAIEPDGIDAGRYQISPWRQDDAGQWPPPRGEIRFVCADDLEDEIGDLVGVAEEYWAGVASEVAIEFVLPRALLNLPVHSWSTDRRSGDPSPLFISYPIVIRSLERLETRQWHRRWRLRWRALEADPSVDRVYFCHEKDTEEPHRLDSILSDDQWVMMVLTESPPVRPVPGQDQLFAALRAGLPILVWHPTAGVEALREVVSWIVGANGLGELPYRTQQTRQAIFSDLSVPFDTDILRDLVVLWDDPGRLVGDTFDRPART